MLIEQTMISALSFFLTFHYWQIAQQFAVQDQAQETKGCPWNEFLNTYNLILP